MLRIHIEKCFYMDFYGSENGIIYKKRNLNVNAFDMEDYLK